MVELTLVESLAASLNQSHLDALVRHDNVIIVEFGANLSRARNPT